MEFGKNLITALISIIVTVVGGLLLYYLQNKEAKLRYSVEKIPPFESQNEKLNIYHITIINDGNSVAEDVICKIQLLPANVKEYRINSEAPITFNDSLIKQEIDVETSNLNPNESYVVSILATSSSVFPEKPSVKIRAKGINAVEESLNLLGAKSFKEKTLSMLMVIIATMASIITLILRKKISGDNLIHQGEQNEIMAYLCGIHGLHAEVERYLALPRVSTYWAEIDRLSSLGVTSTDNGYKTKVIKVIEDLLGYARMADTSIGIGYYNIARLYKSIGDNTNSELYLEKSKKLIPKLLKTRKKLDPIFL